ncbi:3-oxo-tetronate kinase [Mesorhizobium humile]|uniref:3-oxo-tetronate kinase n=1 Tax=Mesorhizobium humile TaxID=3072313 RepID=A0ABU4YRS3_9HYPH|nr:MULTISPECIES: 3-oxo-tetronate kinase [unclassified Mesorhizobium]MDX8463513.1 four-carbon acid sugar kinase family protein [Mesorhizobium sp. VK2D]MDX8489670.1 four-carbon acid sugar kinase family protein [Mesorhizobium sp. VK2B]
MQPIIGIVADDLTGGMETAAMLVALGVDCGLVTRLALVQHFANSPAVVVAQKTRVISAAEAVRKSEDAAQRLLDIGARRLFFKYCATFDSTDDGNIGPVADSLLALTRATHTGFCPSSGDLARSVFQGHLFVGAQLVSESPKRFDPLTPMTDPNLVRVLQRQSKLAVGLLPHNVVRAEPASRQAYLDHLVAQGVRHVIMDAIYAEDLAAVAALTVDWPLMTGNAPIIRHYPALWRERGWLDDAPPKRPLPAVEGPGVVLAGSCAERTLEQLAAFEQARPVHRIDIASVGSVEAAVEQALDWAGTHLDDGPIAIATSAGPEQVGTAQARHGREGAASFAEAILGRLSVELRRRGVRRFLVAGGETSGSVVEQLGIDRLRIGAYQGPGIARATTEEGEIVALSLKSGKLGPPDMFLPTLESMRHPEP